MRSAAADPARTGPPGRRERRKVTTRRDLLLAGRKLFGNKGLYESRVEDLTEHAGIAKGTLYRYFHTKDELIRAVVDQAFADLRQCVAERVQGARRPAEALARIAEAHLDFYAENPDLMRVLHQARGMLQFSRREWRPLRTSLLRHLDYVASLVRLTDAGRALSRPHCMELALVLFGSSSGVASVLAAADPCRATRPVPRPVIAALGRAATRYTLVHSSATARADRLAVRAP